MKHVRTTLAALASVAVMLAIPAGAQAQVRSCHYPYGYGPRNDRSLPIGGVSVRNMSCSAGLHAISIGRLGHRPPFATPGFGCYALKVYHVGNLTLGADIRCVRGTKAFRFSWAT